MRDRIQDFGASRLDLVIPERYMIAQQTGLETSWDAFEPTSGYLKDILINIGGSFLSAWR